MRERLAGLSVRGFGVLTLALAAPFAAFLDANRAELIPLVRVGAIFLAVLLVTFAVYVAVVAATPGLDARRVAYAGAGVVLLFFNYDAIFGGGRFDPGIALLLWVVLTVGVAALVYRVARVANVRWFAVLFLVALLALPSITYVSYKADQTPAAEADSNGDGPSIALPDESPEELPDIYWFVLDEFGRPDQLEKMAAIDNREVVDGLEERGFTVYDETYTSYPVTVLAMSSVLAMDYVLTDEEQLDAGIYSLTEGLRGANPVVDHLHAAGYEYLYSDPGLFAWNRCNPDIADHCLPATQSGLPLDEIDLSLLDLTPVGELDLAPAPYTDPLDVVEQAQAIERDGRPRFVEAHVLSPHEPYWFGEGCERRDHPIDEGFLASEYPNEIDCLDDQLLAAVDAVLDEDPDVWIVVQSDTGSKHGITMSDALEDYSSDGLTSRYAAFEATHLPDECTFPDGPRSTVNTFRLVLACLAEEEPELLPYRGFFWRHVDPDEVEELDQPPWEQP